MDVDAESNSDDEEELMEDGESDEEERSSTPALAIVIGPHRGDTPPITFGLNGFPVTKKRRGSGSGASRSFDVGLSRNRR